MDPVALRYATCAWNLKFAREQEHFFGGFSAEVVKLINLFYDEGYLDDAELEAVEEWKSLLYSQRDRFADLVKVCCTTLPCCLPTPFQVANQLSGCSGRRRNCRTSIRNTKTSQRTASLRSQILHLSLHTSFPPTNSEALRYPKRGFAHRFLYDHGSRVQYVQKQTRSPHVLHRQRSDHPRYPPSSRNCGIKGSWGRDIQNTLLLSQRNSRNRQYQTRHATEEYRAA